MIVLKSESLQPLRKIDERAHLLGKPLSPREWQVTQRTCAGRFPTEIAKEMNVSIKSVSELMRRIKLKTGARNAVELTLMAIKQGLVTCDVVSTTDRVKEN